MAPSSWEATAPSDRALHARPDLDVPFVVPMSETEMQVAEAWEKILGIARLGVHDSFFVLGGDSMLGPRLLLEIYRRTGAELTLRSLFRAPTIAEMARCVEEILRGAPTQGAGELDLAAEAVLDPVIVPAPTSAGLVEDPRAVFLTGVTGFLGAFLAAELLPQHGRRPLLPGSSLERPGRSGTPPWQSEATSGMGGGLRGSDRRGSGRIKPTSRRRSADESGGWGVKGWS